MDDPTGAATQKCDVTARTILYTTAPEALNSGVLFCPPATRALLYNRDSKPATSVGMQAVVPTHMHPHRAGLAEVIWHRCGKRMFDPENWYARANMQARLEEAAHQRLVQTAREAQRDARAHPHKWTDHIRLRVLRRLDSAEWMIARPLRRRTAM